MRAWTAVFKDLTPTGLVVCESKSDLTSSRNRPSRVATSPVNLKSRPEQPMRSLFVCVIASCSPRRRVLDQSYTQRCRRDVNEWQSPCRFSVDGGIRSVWCLGTGMELIRGDHYLSCQTMPVYGGAWYRARQSLRSIVSGRSWKTQISNAGVASTLEGDRGLCQSVRIPISIGKGQNWNCSGGHGYGAFSDETENGWILAIFLQKGWLM